MFILVMIGLFAFIYLNGRIAILEQMLKNLKAQSPVQSPATTISGSAAASTASAPIGVAQTAYVPTPSPATPAPAKPREILSTEEAGGRFLGKIGIAAVFIGVSFFLKYAFDNNLIGVTGRIILGLFAGIFLVVLGQYLRKKYTGYSDILMGGGIGILYLTIFAAFAFYSLISQPVALICLAIVTALSVVISVFDKAFTLAAIGIVGGFITPLLVSYDHEGMVGLFMYILVLDVGVLLVSLREKWIGLNYLAFVGTVFVFLGWFAQFYNDDLLAPVMFFLSAYFLVFLFSTIVHHLIRREATTGADLGMVTLNALLYFGASYALLNPDYGDFVGFFAVFMAIVYMLVAYLAYATNPEDAALNLYLPGIAILFVTLAVPIQFDGTWVTLAWLVEAALIAALGSMIRRPGYYAFSSIVYVVGLMHLFSDQFMFGSTPTPFLNRGFFLCAVAVLVAYLIGAVLYQVKELVMGSSAKSLGAAFFLAAHILTVVTVSQNISFHYDRQIRAAYESESARADAEYNYSGTYGRTGYYAGDVSGLNNQRNTVISIFWALYAAVLIGIGFTLHNRFVRLVGLALFFITALKVFVDVWSLGPLYRIISSIIFGVIALLGSFAYARYKDRLKDIL